MIENAQTDLTRAFSQQCAPLIVNVAGGRKWVDMANNHPSGTVAFLFTDIEGSTKLAQQHPHALPALLARHHSILHQAIESHDGYVFQIIGDAFCAAFHTATDALNAALAAQRMLHQEPWAPAPIKVRMGINTGEAQAGAIDPVAGGYAGYSTMARTQRVTAIAYGEQILLSNTSAELVRDKLPAGITLRDLGEQRLKDLIRPEHIFQLVAPDLPSDFPPLKTLATRPNNLPAQLTSFVGREKEIDAVKQLLARARLVTLTGAGGCGKTRLSLQVAADELVNFSDGVWLIELAPLSDPEIVPRVLGSALGLRDESGRPSLETLKDFLRNKNVLIILDNCEHLIEACAKLADAVLRVAPQIKLLASSREALGIAGEQIFAVPCLQVPDTHVPVTAETLQNESVRLFVERAVAVQPGFALIDANAFAVAKICRRLDGIPLAIELAAARVKTLSIEDIAQRLDDRFRLLTGGSRTALARQQTLRALVDWSYNLLNAQERLLLHRLSVFAGGWTLQAAEEICSDENIPKFEILDRLIHLVDKSLVILDESDENQAPRYRMLETIRQYAREKLFDSDEGDRVRTRQLQYFVQFSEAAEMQFYGAEQATFLNRAQAELENLRTALEWSQKDEFVDAGLRIVGALWQFWFRRGHWTEAFERAAGLLSRPTPTQDKAVRSKALLAASVLAWCRDDQTTENAYLEESLSLARELGEPGKPLLAVLVTFFGYIKLYQDFARARSLAEEGLLRGREISNQWITGLALCTLGQAAEVEGDPTAARRLFEEDLQVLRDIGNNSILAAVRCNLGGVICQQGDPETGKAHMKAGLTIYHQLGDRARLTIVLLSLGRILSQQGDLIAARSYLEESLEIAQGLGAREQTANAFIALGELASHEQDFARAREMYEQSLDLFRQIGRQTGVAMALGSLERLHSVPQGKKIQSTNSH